MVAGGAAPAGQTLVVGIAVLGGDSATLPVVVVVCVVVVVTIVVDAVAAPLVHRMPVEHACVAIGLVFATQLLLGVPNESTQSTGRTWAPVPHDTEHWGCGFEGEPAWNAALCMGFKGGRWFWADVCRNGKYNISYS